MTSEEESDDNKNKEKFLSKLVFLSKLKFVIIFVILVGSITAIIIKFFEIKISGTDTLLIELFFGMAITIIVYYSSKKESERNSKLIKDIHNIEGTQQGMIQRQDDEIKEQKEKRRILEIYAIGQIMIDLRKILDDHEYLKDTFEFEKLGYMDKTQRNDIVTLTFEKIITRWGYYHENINQDLIIAIDKVYQKVYDFSQPSSFIHGNMQQQELDIMRNIDGLYKTLEKKLNKITDKD